MSSYVHNACLTSVLPTFDVDVQRKRRRWEWLIRTSAGECLLYGRERSRAEARYKAARALFQLLASIPYQKCRQKTLTRPET